MNRLWHGISLTPGVRMMLGLLAFVGLATVIGASTKLYDLNLWLALSSPGFESGRIWQIVTYVLLPVSLWSFLMNGFVIVFLGQALERIWSRREWWIYCLVVTVGTGAAKIIFSFAVPGALAGPSPLIFGLLAAWGFLFRYEKNSFGPGSEIMVGLLALIAGLVNFVLIWFSVGLGAAIVMLGGALVGLCYLGIQEKIIAMRAGRVAASNRINRLEI